MGEDEREGGDKEKERTSGGCQRAADLTALLSSLVDARERRPLEAVGGLLIANKAAMLLPRLMKAGSKAPPSSRLKYELRPYFFCFYQIKWPT